MDKIRVFAGPGDHLIQIRNLDLVDLLVQTAANIIQTCEENEDLEMTKGVNTVLAENFKKFEREDFVNTLQTQVEFVYALVCAATSERKESWSGMLPQTAWFIAESLSIYQVMKTRICEKDQTIHANPDWGKETAFYKADWTDHNQKFLQIFAPTQK